MPHRVSRTDSHPAKSARAERFFTDADGVRWHAYEQGFGEYDRRSTSLIFASEGAVRRVRLFPANWAELTDLELVALSWNA
jgi:hypothetical protein